MSLVGYYSFAVLWVLRVPPTGCITKFNTEKAMHFPHTVYVPFSE